MIGVSRYTRILALFDEESPALTVAEISARLETSASTLYRLMREMVAAGMLESTVESQYRLGPLFIEYYRRIRLTDPLIRSGEMFLAPLLAQTGLACTAILARLYGKGVMCVAEKRAPTAGFVTSYELGRPMPMLKGATSKAVLSTLPPRIAKSLLSKEFGLKPEALALLADELAGIRKKGFCETHGEVDRDLVGLSVPLCNQDQGVHASLSIILVAQQLTSETRPVVLTALSATARMIQAFMAGASQAR